MIGAMTTLAANPIDHVTDKPLVYGGDAGALSSTGEFWWISNYTIMLIVGAIITAAIVIPAARRIATSTGKERGLDDYRAQGLWANLVESVCLYLRDEVFKPVLQEETDTYTPMLWSLFWFILVCNLVGLIPVLDVTGFFGLGYHGHGIGGTATQSIWVCAGLSLVAFLFWNGIAIKKDPIGYVKHLTAGAPWFMWPIMVPVEIIGTFVKPIGLTLRLFANMTGGHIIIAVLLSFSVAIVEAFGSVGYGLAIIPILGATAINVLEILVAFIQAYIFVFLTCLFLGQLVVHEHEEHEEHDHEEQLPHATEEGVDQTKAVDLGESKAAGAH